VTVRVVTRPGSAVRIAPPRPGEAVAVTRYGRRAAVVLHPDDFDAMCRATAIAERLARLTDEELTALEQRLPRVSQDVAHDPRDVGDEVLLDG
jgi:PHD/YefM family antitoxin component YafN of YafNO toxin-antitoxin module